MFACDILEMEILATVPIYQIDASMCILRYVVRIFVQFQCKSINLMCKAGLDGSLLHIWCGMLSQC